MHAPACPRARSSRALLAVTAFLALSLGLPGPRLRPAGAEDPPATPVPEGATRKEAEQEHRNRTRGYVCLSFGLAQLFTPEQREEHGVKVEKGLIISAVTPGGPAEEAGVRVGDVPVSFFGHPLPDASEVKADTETFGKFLEEATRPISNQIDPGATVELVVLRDGKKLTFKMTALSFTTMEALNEEAQRESWSVKVPKPEGRGAAKAGAFDFQTVPSEASVPEDFLPVTGWWEVVDEPAGQGVKPGSTPGNKVLQQSSDEMGLCLGLVVADGRVYGDAAAQVRFRLVSGERSVSAGLIVRAKDRKNYYAVVVDGVEQALSILKVERAETKVLAKAAIPSPRLKTWHSLAVVAKGASITATFGDATATVKDEAIAAGWWGLCTAQDATTMFDDLAITPGGK